MYSRTARSLTASTSDDGRSAGRMQVLPDNGIQIRSAAEEKSSAADFLSSAGRAFTGHSSQIIYNWHIDILL